MRFKRSTQILFASALVLATGIAVYEGTIVPDRQEQEIKQQQVFSFTDEQVKSLLLTTPDLILQFDRLPPQPNSIQPRWQFTILNSSQKSDLKDTKPQPANEAYVSFLIDLLVSAKSDRVLSVSPEKKPEYGLDRPQATIEVKLEGDRTHSMALGGRDFSANFLYAIADPPADAKANLSVLLVSSNFENGVNRPLSEWKAEPEKPKETAKPKESEKPNSQTLPEAPILPSLEPKLPESQPKDSEPTSESKNEQNVPSQPNASPSPSSKSN
jgi:Domain of unknown function (DUF4340)